MSSDKEVIREKIINLYDFYAKKNLEGMLEAFEEEYDPIVIGTGEDEVTYSYSDLVDQFNQDISQAGEITIDIKKIKINTSDKIAWAFIELEMTIIIDRKQLNLMIRATQVLEKVNGNWFIRHSHSSIPFNFQATGSSYPSLEGMENTIAKWLEIFNLGIIEFLDTQEENKIKHYLSQVQEIVHESQEKSKHN